LNKLTKLTKNDIFVIQWCNTCTRLYTLPYVTKSPRILVAQAMVS